MVIIHHSLVIFIINRPSYLKSTVQKDWGSPLVSCHYTPQYRFRPAAHSDTQFLHTAEWVLLGCCRGAGSVGKQTWAAPSGTGPADVPQQRDVAAVGISAKRQKILLQPMFFSPILWVTWAYTPEVSNSNCLAPLWLDIHLWEGHFNVLQEMPLLTYFCHT